ncbi:MAG: mechanosensitive ion channel [Epulopiscium sp.]|nr:mechanosensitive ion channel [Candidatus Epulonipiscium sp.]
MGWLNNVAGLGFALIFRLLGAVLMLLVAWIVAAVVRKVVEKLLIKLGVDKYLSKGTDPLDLDVGKSRVASIARMFYLLVFVLFLPGILERLDMGSVSEPIITMMNKLLGFIPSLIGAGLVLFVGFFVAKILRDLLKTFLTTINVDKYYNKISPDKSQEADEKGQDVLADVLSKIAFGIILIPVITVALEVLNIESLTEPIVVILNRVLMMIPNIFVAIILLVVGYYIAKFIGQILEALLERVGMESIFNWADEKTNSNIPRFNISKTISGIVKFLIMLFITVEALSVLKLSVLNAIGYAVISYIPAILSGVIIIGIGVFAGYFVEGLIKNYSKSNFSALLGKYTIIIFAVFMTLEQIKFASTIVSIAFLLVLGGLSVAFALSFGLGGRDFAKRQLEKIEEKVEKDKE